MPDIFAQYQVALDSPANNFFAITPSDSTNFTVDTRGIYVGTGGNIVCISASVNGVAGAAITFNNVPAGTVLPIRTSRVNTTNTTATNLVGLY